MIEVVGNNIVVDGHVVSTIHEYVNNSRVIRLGGTK